MFQDSVITHDVWIPEPRWSWYRTPLWRVTGSVLKIRTFEPDPGRFHNSGGSLTSKDLRAAHITTQYVYFTAEEFVMFKLANMGQTGEYDLVMLRQGMIYS